MTQIPPPDKVLCHTGSMPRPERYAYRALLARRVTELPVRPLPMLRACRNTRVMTIAEAAEALSLHPTHLDALLDGADAMTFREEGAETRYLVVYRPGGHPARLRFTLAHELGHRVLGHTGTRSPGGKAREEREADLFASHLLCPQPVIDRLRRRFDPLTAEQVAAACYVSLTCARLLATRPPLPPDPLLEAVDALLAPAADALNPIAAQNIQHPLTGPRQG